MSVPPEPNPESSFDRIVDDETPRREAVEWAVAELTGGRSFEQVLAGLGESGWSGEDADAILELARQQTRHIRGVTTRDEVVRQANRNYRKGMTGWVVGMPSLAAAARLLYSLGSLLSLRRGRRE